MKDPIFQRLLNLHPKFSDLSLGRIKKLLKRIDFNERIQLRSKDISNQKLLKYLKLCENKNQGNLITFFEITTAAAFRAFQDHKADYLILEVGLGGRFDATNILKKTKYAAITPISLDHQDYLGNSLNQIAFEKLGILNSKLSLIHI